MRNRLLSPLAVKRLIVDQTFILLYRKEILIASIIVQTNINSKEIRLTFQQVQSLFLLEKLLFDTFYILSIYWNKIWILNLKFIILLFIVAF